MGQFHSSVLCLPMICLCWRKSVINRSHVLHCPVEYGLKIPRCVVQIYFSKIILTISKIHCFEERNNKAFYSEHGLWSIKSFSSIKIGISLSLLCKMSRCCNSKKQKHIVLLIENIHSVCHCSGIGKWQGNCHLL